MSLFKQLTHASVTVTDVAKAREFYIGPSKRAGARVMESAGPHR